MDGTEITKEIHAGQESEAGKIERTDHVKEFRSRGSYILSLESDAGFFNRRKLRKVPFAREPEGFGVEVESQGPVTGGLLHPFTSDSRGSAKIFPEQVGCFLCQPSMELGEVVRLPARALDSVFIEQVFLHSGTDLDGIAGTVHAKPHRKSMILELPFIAVVVRGFDQVTLAVK